MADKKHTVPKRYDWVYGGIDEPMTKQQLTQLYIAEFLTKTQQMFRYTNLPDTIPQKDLELILQVNGNATITKVDGKLYAFRTGLGGVPNEYYLPTVSIVANPYLKYNAELTIDKDCVVILNDPMYVGLLPKIRHAAQLLAECDISFRFAAVNLRIPAIVTTPTDDAKKEAEIFFDKIFEGKSLGVMTDEEFVKRINVYDYAINNTGITHLIELKQYIKGSFYQDIGIQSQFNMKREAINEAESVLNEDVLFPFVDEMLKQRKIGIDKVNKMYGTNIEVELNDVWEDLRTRQELNIERQESEIEVEKAAINTEITEGEEGEKGEEDV